METPFFFPAISSVRTNFPIKDYLEIIRKIDYPAFLVSSYDLDRESERENGLVEEVTQMTAEDTITLLDSGNYEAVWYRDDEWDFEKLEGILGAIDVDLCFSFDVFRDDRETLRQHVRETITSIAKTAGAQRSGTTIPILHAGGEEFPRVVQDVVEGINPQIVGIPERDLGQGVVERAATIRKIRTALDKSGRDIPIHMLGTGHPISILIYSLSGADMFDALEWCTTSVDPSTALLHHFASRELLGCQCTACTMAGMSYPVKTIAHNLLFYMEFMEQIRSHIADNSIDQILEKYLPSESLGKVRSLVGLS
jgi:queuine/archaeosine tRNA-ribosyltransferase